MTTHNPHSGSPKVAQSGFSILLHSAAVGWATRNWTRLNNRCRWLFPLLHLFMLAVTVAILGAVVFANLHRPCWYDEICMLDPAFHRVTTGVWHSIAQVDSFDSVPFAPNYPLLINMLRLLMACFGVNFWVLRGSMLLLGLVPVAALLWFFRKKGLYQSRGETIQAAFFAACFPAFPWATLIRPEAVLLSVVTLFVFAWAFDRPVPLFLVALLVPLCGLQWNVLLVPAALHWLVFGGRFRNPLIVAVAFVLSSAATIAAYHALGMWPSYLQEAARVGGLDAVRSALEKLHGAWSVGDFRWLFYRLSSLVAVCWVCFAFWGGLSCAIGSGRLRTIYAFAWLCTLAPVFFISLFGQLNAAYSWLLLLPLCLAFPAVLRPLVSGKPLALLAVVLCGPVWLAWGHWNGLTGLAGSEGAGQWMRLAHPRFGQSTLLDEASVEKALAPLLSAEDTVMAPPDLYFAVHALSKEMYTHDYAFHLSPEQYTGITAVIMDASPYDMEIAMLLSIREKTGIPDLFADRAPSPLPADREALFRVTTDDLLAAIGAHWNCTFTEIPLSDPSLPHAIRYRFFRPVFAQTVGEQPPGNTV